MVKKLLIILLIGLPLLVQSQENQDEVLMKIHDREITLGEFERIYHKNNSNPSIEQQSVEEYLELFINFKLKVIEAEELGFDTLQSETQIIPILVGDTSLTMRMGEMLLEEGVFIQGIRPPTVPQGSSRLRVTLMATHARRELEFALDAIEKVGKKLHLI